MFKFKKVSRVFIKRTMATFNLDDRITNCRKEITTTRSSFDKNYVRVCVGSAFTFIDMASLICFISSQNDKLAMLCFCATPMFGIYTSCCALSGLIDFYQLEILKKELTQLELSKHLIDNIPIKKLDDKDCHNT